MGLSFNDYAEIFFDKYGLIKKVDFYDLNSMKKVQFSKSKTKSLAIEDTFSKSILNSTRKRMENARKKFDKYLQKLMSNYCQKQ